VTEQQSGLQRKLGLFPVTNIVIANMIGAGIFTTSGLLMADLQNPVVMICLWFVGGVFAFCGALSYGALGSAMPYAGGEYIFLSKLYHPMAGFLSGWVSFIVGFSAPIAASAMANGHLVDARTAMDVNLAKQLNILINDMGLPMDRILMDPTCAAVGYGIEYGYSVMERLRIAALGGDKMLSMPMLAVVGAEAWKAKEAKVSDGVPETWGNWERRAINWETVTAIALVESGADIVVLRHPESIRAVKAAIDDLATGG